MVVGGEVKLAARSAPISAARRPPLAKRIGGPVLMILLAAALAGAHPSGACWAFLGSYGPVVVSLCAAGLVWRLYRAERAAHARLSAAVSEARTLLHEANNHLASTVGNCELLSLNPALPEPLRPKAHAATDAAAQTAVALQQLQQRLRLYAQSPAAHGIARPSQQP